MRGRDVAVEGDVGVGEVVDQEHLLLLGEATSLSKKARSTQAVVGLWGNEKMITRGRGHASSTYGSSDSK